MAISYNWNPNGVIARGAPSGTTPGRELLIINSSNTDNTREAVITPANFPTTNPAVNPGDPGDNGLRDVARFTANSEDTDSSWSVDAKARVLWLKNCFLAPRQNVDLNLEGWTVNILDNGNRFGGIQLIGGDAIVDEIVRHLDVEPSSYIDLTSMGYNVYTQTIQDIVSYPSEERGATYWISNIVLLVNAEFLGIAAGQLPVQLPMFTFANFAVNPVGMNIANHDAGTITTQLTGYSSPNNGFNFVDATVSLAAGADGTLVGNVLTIDSDDTTFGLITNLNYASAQDATVTETLSRVNIWNRVNPIRFGSLNEAPIFTDDNTNVTGIRNLASFTDTNRDINLGVVNPNGQTIRINAAANDFLYIMYDENQPDLTNIEQSAQGLRVNIQGLFDSPYTVGGYKVYRTTNALPIGGAFDIILTT